VFLISRCKKSKLLLLFVESLSFSIIFVSLFSNLVIYQCHNSETCKVRIIHNVPLSQLVTVLNVIRPIGSLTQMETRRLIIHHLVIGHSLPRCIVNRLNLKLGAPSWTRYFTCLENIKKSRYILSLCFKGYKR
jgi:hypothetical protein